MDEIDLGEGEIDHTLENLASISSNDGCDEDDDNTQVEYRTEAILPLHASKGDEHQITVANEVSMYCYKVSHNHLQEVRNKEPTIANKTEKAALTTENAAIKVKVDTLPVAAGTTRSQVSHIRHRSLLHTYVHGALSIIAHNPNPNLN